MAAGVFCFRPPSRFGTMVASDGAGNSSVRDMAAHELLLRYAKPSLTLEKRDMDRAHRLAALLVWFLRERAIRFMQRRKTAPLLYQYSSDATPLQTKVSYRMRQKGLEVRRRGKKSSEFLVQRLFLADPAGDVSVVFERPLVMDDKCAITHWFVAGHLFPSGRDLGHENILVVHHCYDRALAVPLGRLHYQHLQMSFGQGHCDSRVSFGCELLEETSWRNDPKFVSVAPLRGRMDYCSLARILDLRRCIGADRGHDLRKCGSFGGPWVWVVIFPQYHTFGVMGPTPN